MNSSQQANPMDTLTALGKACFAKNPEQIRQALAAGANPDEIYKTVHPYSSIPPLGLCMHENSGSENDLQCVRLLLDAGANRFIFIENINGERYTALTFLAYYPSAANVFNLYVTALPNDIAALQRYLQSPNTLIRRATLAKQKVKSKKDITKQCGNVVFTIIETNSILKETFESPYELTSMEAVALAEEYNVMIVEGEIQPEPSNTISFRLQMLYRFVQHQAELQGLHVNKPNQLAADTDWIAYIDSAMRAYHALNHTMDEALPGVRASSVPHATQKKECRYFGLKKLTDEEAVIYVDRKYARTCVDIAYELALDPRKAQQINRVYANDLLMSHSSDDQYRREEYWSLAIHFGPLMGHTPITAAVMMDNAPFIQMAIKVQHVDLNEPVKYGPLTGMTPLVLALYYLHHHNKKSVLAYELLNYFVSVACKPKEFFTGDLNEVLPGFSIEKAVAMYGNNKCKELLANYLKNATSQPMETAAVGAVNIRYCKLSAIGYVNAKRSQLKRTIKDIVSMLNEKIAPKIANHPDEKLLKEYQNLEQSVARVRLQLPEKVEVTPGVTPATIFKIIDDSLQGMNACEEVETVLLILISMMGSLSGKLGLVVQATGDLGGKEVEVVLTKEKKKAEEVLATPVVEVKKPVNKAKPKRYPPRAIEKRQIAPPPADSDTQSLSREQDKAAIRKNNAAIIEFNNELERVQLNTEAQHQKLLGISKGRELDQDLKDELAAIHQMTKFELIDLDNDDELEMLVAQSKEMAREVTKRSEELESMRKRFGEHCAVQRQNLPMTQSSSKVKPIKSKPKTVAHPVSVEPVKETHVISAKKEPANEYSHFMRSDDDDNAYWEAVEKENNKKKAQAKKNNGSKRNSESQSASTSSSSSSSSSSHSPLMFEGQMNVIDTDIQLTGAVSQISSLLAQLGEDYKLYQVSKEKDAIYFINVCAMQAKLLAVYELILTLQSAYPNHGIFSCLSVAASIRNASKYGFHDLIFNLRGTNLSQLIEFTLNRVTSAIKKIGIMSQNVKITKDDLPGSVGVLLNENRDTLPLDLIDARYQTLMDVIKSISSKLSGDQAYLVGKETQAQALVMCFALVSLLMQQANKVDSTRFSRPGRYSSTVTRNLFPVTQSSNVFFHPDRSDQVVRNTILLNALVRFKDKAEINAVIGALTDLDMCLFLNEIQVQMSHMPEHEFASHHSHTHLVLQIADRLLTHHANCRGQFINKIVAVIAEERLLLTNWQNLAQSRPLLKAVYIYDLICRVLTDMTANELENIRSRIDILFANNRSFYNAFQETHLKGADEMALFARITTLFESKYVDKVVVRGDICKRVS